MRKINLLLTFSLVFSFCGPTDDEIQAQIDSAVNEALETSTTLSTTTTSTIPLKSYKVRIRVIEEVLEDYPDIVLLGGAFCAVENRLLITNPPGAHSWSIYTDDNERLLTGYFEKGKIILGPYKDEFSGEVDVERLERACYYRFDVSLPENDAYIFQLRGGELIFTEQKLTEMGGFAITLDLTD